ncbi:Galactose-1-phosphate uridylyltransferase [Sphingomonas antarctica]|uniref:UDP-glucose--hexose-1-phosphate uridylyltransferase n=1 Tax=Sphingomonas antarctica TaxID=2040274 RepID=UPI0039EB002F
MTDKPHRRRNLLTNEWVLVSPHRAARPWQGAVETINEAPLPHHDPDCYLCPGNARSASARNPNYADTFVFPNDFPALLGEGGPTREDPFFQSQPATGEARVVCYSPDHAATFATLSPEAARQVVQTWCHHSAELGQRWAHVQIFENKGAAMGCSSPHPHGQIWASDFVPTLAAREDAAQRERPNLLADYAEAELKSGERVVESNDHWLIVVPWWAGWPFETLVIARDPAARLEDLSATAREALADILLRLTKRYDALFATSFPYSMGWHGAPHEFIDIQHWRLHAHFYPPLLRSATVRKFMVGFELLAEAQRDLTPEQAAQRLRAAL